MSEVKRHFVKLFYLLCLTTTQSPVFSQVPEDISFAVELGGKQIHLKNFPFPIVKWPGFCELGPAGERDGSFVSLSVYVVLQVASPNFL